ncbi:MAG: hypothetical protein A2283_16300 [Lentisphaerae bacterium RIFOXYA12_FULL_48_11]|nr:MAG: hypothetical protein A2283_16300 [Lentisphaerae bacterium RIFOXYA12_FULL_48_11]
MRLSQMNMTRRLDHKVRRVWAVLRLAAKTFSRIDGVQWAGSFAFNAFFALFPLMILVVALASTIMDRDRAGKAIIVYIESYVPIGGEMQSYIFDTIAGVVKARGQAGVVAFLILIWVVLQCFTTLICATNRAWGTTVHAWWRLPLKSLVLLGLTAGASLLGMTLTVMMRMSKSWLYTVSDFHSWIYAQARLFIPLVVVFLSLSVFYRLAPRRPMRFAQVWAAALCATALLQIAESLFAIYLKDFATLNAVYGAFGGTMALLLWVYLSGCIFIFGACLCAAQAEERSASLATGMAN